MQIQDKLKELLISDDGKVYVYVSSSKENLDKVRLFMNENVDFSKTTTKGVLVFPVGIGRIKGNVDGVYLDEELETIKFVQDNITMLPNSFIQFVNAETQEIK